MVRGGGVRDLCIWKHCSATKVFDVVRVVGCDLCMYGDRIVMKVLGVSRAEPVRLSGVLEVLQHVRKGDRRDESCRMGERQIHCTLLLEVK